MSESVEALIWLVVGLVAIRLVTIMFERDDDGDNWTDPHE